MIIIGITGTNGSGKGTVVDYIVKNMGFFHYSVRNYLLEIIRKKDLPENRETMISVANSMREEHNNPSYITDRLYDMARERGRDCIIESIRTLGEIKSLRKKGDFFLIAVEADARIRYNRILLRKSETDHISFHTFLENEKKEMLSDDPNKQNLSACIENADYVLNNNGSVQELNSEIEKLMKKINKN